MRTGGVDEVAGLYSVWMRCCARAQAVKHRSELALAGKDSHGVALAHYPPGAGNRRDGFLGVQKVPNGWNVQH